MLAVPLLAMAGLGLALGCLRRPGWRRAGILIVSLAAAYLLQPATPLRYASFWMPTAAVGLTVLVWAAVRPAQASWRQALPTVAALAGVVFLLAFTHYFPVGGWLASLRPPPLGGVFAAGIAVGLVAVAASRPRFSPWLTAALLAAILGIFIVFKSEPLRVAASAALRGISGQSPQLASPIDLVWLGFSYLAFRLLHVLLDQKAGRLPAISLSELVSYAFFFPALTAGPIDRVDRFVEDLRRAPEFGPDTLREGGTRIVLGLAKKFVVADSLAIIALQPLNADHVTSAGWLWILLYAFSFQLYFDFSGYTDVAIGVARLAGIRLPENFQRPYLQPNLTAFWNSWHMTLTQWLRAYVFNPMTRGLRSARRPWPTALILLIGQLTTMVLIGLWHGIGWGFLIWGAWHGLGLFVQNRWSTWMRGASGRWWSRPAARRVAAGIGILLTFHFVSLGWVWFTLTDPGQAGRTFLRLFGG